MKLYVLFGLRFQRYAGEYSPEALSVIDEYSHEESAVWIHERYHEQRATGDFESLRIVEIDFDRDELDMIFRPPPIPGNASDPVSELVKTCQSVVENLDAKKLSGAKMTLQEGAVHARLGGCLSRIPDLTS